MTVKELVSVIEGEDKFVLIDSDSCIEVYNQKNVEKESYQITRNKFEKRFEKFEDCEVLGVRSHSDDEIAIYIDAPSRRFETWATAEYSIQIALEVPYGANEEEALRKYAESKFDKLPKTMMFNGDEWTYDWNNINSGGFYDCIEEY